MKKKVADRFFSFYTISSAPSRKTAALPAVPFLLPPAGGSAKSPRFGGAFNSANRALTE